MKQAVEGKPSVKKLPKAVADELLKEGFLSREKYEEMVSTGRITSGVGGKGVGVLEQLVSAGVPKEDVRALEDAIEKVNAALWSGKEYVGRRIDHKDRKGREYKAAIEAALWIKHYQEDGSTSE
jgi:hypothetical protein